MGKGSSSAPARRQRRVFATVLAGAVAIAVLVGVAVPVARRGSEGTGTVPGGALDPRTGIRSTPGLPPRVDPAQVVLGDQIYLYGGRSPEVPLSKGGLLGDNALVDPATGDVRALPPPPFESPLWDARALAVGRTVLLIGRECAVGPDFDPASELVDPDCRPGTYAAAVLDVDHQEWKRLAVPDELLTFRGPNAVLRALGVSSDGRAVLGLGDIAAPQIWTVASGTWARIPDPGVGVKDGCLARDRIVVLSTSYLHVGEIVDENPATTLQPGQSVFGSGSDGYVEPRLSVLELAAPDRWQLSAPASDVRYRDPVPPRVVCMGDRALVGVRTGVSTSMALFGLAPPQPLGAAPPPQGEAMPSPIGRVFDGEVWTGQELVFLPLPNEAGSPTLAFDPSTDRWRTFAGLPAITTGAVWSGDAIVGYAPSGRWSTDPREPPQRTKGGVFRFVVPPPSTS